MENTDIGFFDVILALMILGLVYMETVADQQQYDYQTEKYKRINNNEKLEGIYAKGFTHTGLWAIMRHPNYAAEQAIWIVFYGFSVTATGEIINWSIIGALLLVVLFKSSSDFSEGISEKKYPEYSKYQASVGRFIPKLKP
jgi:steroid 5-alpha reductase family enzyme